MTSPDHRRYLEGDAYDRMQAAVDDTIDNDGAAFPYYSDYVNNFLSSHRPGWWGAASADEVIAFSLSICTCAGCDGDNRPDGSSIGNMSDSDIRSLLLLASQRLADPSKRTRWLEGYAAQLVAERRRRRGAA